MFAAATILALALTVIIGLAVILVKWIVAEIGVMAFCAIFAIFLLVCIAAGTTKED